MRVLVVPNWSFGRDRDLLRKFHDQFPAPGLSLHFLEADIDHNRTVSAFSGDIDLVLSMLRKLCELALDRIDLNRHVGVHPRIGALDVCPFVALPEWDVPFNLLDSRVQSFGEEIAEAYEVPVFMYERSEKGRHEADLPSLRKGGFGGLIGRELNPDYGPPLAHPRLGVTIMGVRDFLIAFNVNLATEELTVARELSKLIRMQRQEGDERFLGMRALGFPLYSRNMTQVSINATMPDVTTVDAVVECVEQECVRAGVKVAGRELIGVIRKRDLAGAQRLPIKAAQVVD